MDRSKRLYEWTESKPGVFDHDNLLYRPDLCPGKIFSCRFGKSDFEQSAL